MKLAMSGAIRPARSAVQLVYALALVVVLTVLAFAISGPFAPASIAAPPARPSAPASAPLQYRIPSEPVDYYDPNYIGSYGG